MQNSKAKNLVFLSILAAWSLILRFFDFPILPAAPFLKIDFSDVAVLMGMLVNGPIGIVTVAFLRDLINFMMKGGEAGIPLGAIMSFTASITMFLPTHLILNHLKLMPKKWKYMLMSITLTLSLTISMALLNYYVALPIYTTVLNFPINDFGQYIIAIAIPFNLIKGGFLSIAQIIVLEIFTKELNKRNILYPAYHLMA